MVPPVAEEYRINPQRRDSLIGRIFSFYVASIDHHSSGTSLEGIKEAIGRSGPLTWVQVYLCITFALLNACLTDRISPLHMNLKVANFSKMRMCICTSSRVRQEGNCSSPSTSHCWQSSNSVISHLLSPPQSVTLPACSLDASPWMPAVVLSYCTFQGTVLCD